MPIAFAIFFTLAVSLYTDVNAQPIKLSEVSGTYAEPIVRTNPARPTDVIVTAHPDHLFFSKDAGKSWRYRKISFDAGVRGDPVAQFDHTGRLFITFLSKEYQIILWMLDTLEGVGSYSSVPRIAAELQDKPWLVIDTSTNLGKAYISFTSFSKDDQGELDTSLIYCVSSEPPYIAWSSPLRVSPVAYDARSKQVHNGAVLLVADSTLAVTWLTPEGIEMATTDLHLTTVLSQLRLSAVGEFTRLNLSGISTMYKYPSIARAVTNGRIYVGWSDQDPEGGLSWRLAIFDPELNEWIVQAMNDHKLILPTLCVDAESSQLFALGYVKMQSGSTDLAARLVSTGDNGGNFHLILNTNAFEPSNDFLGDYLGIEIHNGRLNAVWVETEAIGKNNLFLFTHIKASVQTSELLEPVKVYSLRPLRLGIGNSYGKIKVQLIDLLGRVTWNHESTHWRGQEIIHHHQPKHSHCGLLRVWGDDQILLSQLVRF